MPPIEAGDIEVRVRPFLSAGGPRWDIIRVAVGVDRDVLLIVVDPPKHGQGPFLCWKEFSPDGADRKYGLRDGGIYVRTEGATRPATAEEVATLVERGKRGGQDVDLKVELVGTAIRPPASGEELTGHVDRVVRSLLAMLPSPEPTTTGRGLAASEGAVASSMREIVAMMRVPDMFGADPEDRTAETYTAEVERWADEARDEIPEFLERFVARVQAPVAITVTNRGRTYFEDARLTIHLEGAVEGIAPREGKVGRAGWPPPPPRLWGPRSRMALLDQAARFATPGDPTVQHYVPPRFTWDNGGSISATWEIGDLRPKEVVEVYADAAFIVIVRDPSIDVVHASWTLTAKGHHDVYEGSLELPVADAAGIDDAVADFVRRISR